MEMERLLREELDKRGYSFVFTPHIAKRELWRISGHEENYADSMYAPTSIEEEEYRLKPMNCPFHIGIYKSSPRSYRDLPQRYSEMGMVYRAELSGTLHGLLRVRGFSVDDAHLFVRPDQVHAEVADCLDFAIKVSAAAHSVSDEDFSTLRENGIGLILDMVPNHIFQLITLTAMEPPISFDADAVRDEQAKILRAIQPLTPEEVLNRSIRGQYGEGIVDGERAPAYRSEPKVAPDSPTETFVALKVLIDNWRWADVPFYVRTGKRLPRRVTEVVIRFRRAPFVLFRKTPVERLTPNELVIRIQPDEGISLRFGAKIPGPLVRLGAVKMNFAYADYFGTTPSTGYERLLYDCMVGDATLFQRADMVDAAWTVVTPILDVWRALPPRNFPNYRAGSWGPKEADDLINRDGRFWRKIPE